MSLFIQSRYQVIQEILKDCSREIPVLLREEQFVLETCIRGRHVSVAGADLAIYDISLNRNLTGGLNLSLENNTRIGIITGQSMRIKHETNQNHRSQNCKFLFF